MDRKLYAARTPEREWETPAAEEVRVSAEATMYMGTWQDQDWM